MGKRSDTKRRKGTFSTFGPVNTTPYWELVWQRQGSGFRLLDTSTALPVGPVYRTAGTLLEDLPRFARDFGCK